MFLERESLRRGHQKKRGPDDPWLRESGIDDDCIREPWKRRIECAVRFPTLFRFISLSNSHFSLCTKILFNFPSRSPPSFVSPRGYPIQHDLHPIARGVAFTQFLLSLSFASVARHDTVHSNEYIIHFHSEIEKKANTVKHRAFPEKTSSEMPGLTPYHGDDLRGGEREERAMREGERVLTLRNKPAAPGRDAQNWKCIQMSDRYWTDSRIRSPFHPRARPLFLPAVRLGGKGTPTSHLPQWNPNTSVCHCSYSLLEKLVQKWERGRSFYTVHSASVFPLSRTCFPPPHVSQSSQ